MSYKLIFDVETENLPVYSRFRCMSLTKGTDLDSPIETVHSLKEAVSALIVAMTDPECEAIVGHNVQSFDLPLLVWNIENLGGSASNILRAVLRGQCHKVWDTLIFSKKLFPLREEHSMDSWHGMVNTIYGLEPKVEIDDFSTVDKWTLQKRCEHDVRIQQALTDYFVRTHGAPSTVPCWEADTAFFPLVVDLMTTGVPYRKEHEERARKWLEARITVPSMLRERMFPGVNENSNAQIQRWLMQPQLDEIGVTWDEYMKYRKTSVDEEKKPLAKKYAKVRDLCPTLQAECDEIKGLDWTKKGSPQFNNDNRNAMINRFPELELFVRDKKDRKLLKFIDPSMPSYAENFMADSDFLGTIAIYPSLNIFGTRTHRAAYSSPPLNQFPKPLRNIVGVGQGFLMVGVDIVALEMAIIGKMFEEVMNDTTITDQVRSGRSVKKITLEAFRPAMEKTVLPPGWTLEDMAKKVNYEILYGMGIPALAQQLNASLDIVDECMEKRFPGFRELNRVVQSTVKTATSSNEYGDRIDSDGSDEGTVQTFYGTQVRTTRWKTFNTIGQASGAEYSKRVLTYVDRTLKRHCKARLCIWNHDEGQWIVKDDDPKWVEEVCRGIRDGMEDEFAKYDDGVGFLTGVDYAIGTNWAETH